jgi:hypothetical protein
LSGRDVAGKNRFHGKGNGEHAVSTAPDQRRVIAGLCEVGWLR